MTRSARAAALITTIGLLTAAAAIAGVPNAGQSDLNFGCSFVAGCAQEGVLLLGGQNSSGTVDPSCEKQVQVKDAGGNVVVNSVVIINFTNCYSGGDVRICSTQPFAGLAVNCGVHTVSALTNASGIAVFRIEGYSNLVAANAAGAGEACATVTADGVPLGAYSVATPDLNGALGGASLGLGADDTALFFAQRWAGPGAYHPRANFSRGPSPQGVDGGDTVMYNKLLFDGGSTTNGAAACP